MCVCVCDGSEGVEGSPYLLKKGGGGGGASYFHPTSATTCLICGTSHYKSKGYSTKDND